MARFWPILQMSKEGIEMFKLVIEKEKWLRGDNRESMLLRPSDGLMCCLGFRCLAMGHTNEEIESTFTPATVVNRFTKDLRPEWMKVKMDYEMNSITVQHMMQANDDPTLTDEERISKLQALALSVGEEWVFV